MWQLSESTNILKLVNPQPNNTQKMSGILDTSTIQNDAIATLKRNWGWAAKAAFLLGFLIIYCKILWRVIIKETKETKLISRYSLADLLTARKYKIKTPTAFGMGIQGRLHVVNLDPSPERRDYQSNGDTYVWRGNYNNRYYHEHAAPQYQQGIQYSSDSFATRLGATGAYVPPFAPPLPSTFYPVGYAGSTTSDYNGRPLTWHQDRWPSSGCTGDTGHHQPPVVTGAPCNTDGKKAPASLTVGNPCISQRTCVSRNCRPAEANNNASAVENEAGGPTDLMQTIRQLVSLISAGNPTLDNSAAGKSSSQNNKTQSGVDRGLGSAGIVKSTDLGVAGYGRNENDERRDTPPQQNKEDASTVSSTVRKGSPKTPVPAELQVSESHKWRQEQLLAPVQHRQLASWISTQHSHPTDKTGVATAIVIGRSVLDDSEETAIMCPKTPGIASCTNALGLLGDQNANEDSCVDAAAIKEALAFALEKEVESESEKMLLELVINFKFLQRYKSSSEKQPPPSSLPSLHKLITGTDGTDTFVAKDIWPNINKEARAILRGVGLFKTKEVLREILELLKAHDIPLEPSTIRQFSFSAEQCGEKDGIIRAMNTMRIISVPTVAAAPNVAGTVVQNVDPSALSVDAPEFKPMAQQLDAGKTVKSFPYKRKTKWQRK